MRLIWSLLLFCVVAAVPLAGTSPYQEKKDEKADQKKTGKSFIGLSDARMEFTWSIDSQEEGPLTHVFECFNRCQGGKHDKHADCDMSCSIADGIKTHNHSFFCQELEKQTDLDEKGTGEPKKSNEAQLSADFSQFGIPTTCIVSNSVKSILNRIFEGSGKTWEKRVEHACWNKTPCSSSDGYVHLRKWTVTVEYELLYDKTEGDKKTTEHGPKRKLRWELLVAPADDEDRTLTLSEPAIDCKCEVKQTKTEKMSFDPDWPDETASIGSGPDQRPLTAQDIANLVTDISVEDMNYADITISDAAGTQFLIPAGWELECLDGSGQNVQLEDDITGDSNLFAGPAGSLAKHRVHVLCLQPHKPEPTPGLKYRLVPPSSPGLGRLAQNVRKSTIRGSWNQVRLWIAQAHSSLADIQKVLIPKPGERTYLAQLYSASQAGAIDTQDPEVRQIMELRLLLADKNNLDAAAWLLQQELLIDSKGTVAWLKDNAKGFQDQFAKGDAVGQAKYMARLARAAAEFPDGLAAAACLLADCVPEDQRKAVAETEDAAVAVAELTITTDADGTGRMLDWLEAVRPSYTRIAAQNVNPALDASVTARAASLAKPGAAG